MKKNLVLLASLLTTSLLSVTLSGCDGTTSIGDSSTNSTSNPTSSASNPTNSENSSVEDNKTSNSSNSSNNIESTESSSSNSSTGELVFDTTKDVTITLYTTLSATASYGLVFDAYLEKFMQSYPNIKVEHTRVGGYDDVRDQVKTELGNGSGPNVAYCYPDHIALYNMARQVQTLDKFINNTQEDEKGNLLYGLTSTQINDFIPAYYNEGKAYGDNLMYTLPLYKSTEVLYYNTEVFTANNLKVPTHWFKDDEGLDPTTSMEYACETLKTADPTCIPLGYDSDSNWFITMCEQLGTPYTSATGNHYLFDTEANRNFVTRFNEWYKKGYVTTQLMYGAYTSGLFTNTTDTTISKSYMTIGSSAGATHQAPADGSFNVGITSIPQANAANPKVISQGPSLCIFKKADQQQVLASWLLTRYLTTDVAFQAEISMSSGYAPVINSVLDNETYLEFLDSADGTSTGVAALSASVCMEQADAYFVSPAFVGSSTAREQVGKLISSVFSGTMTVAEAFQYAVTECNAE